MTTFKVLIIGGSITGLTLANILHRYGIEYTLLEKHDNVTPALGASIGVLPNGACVLAQLGCYDELMPMGASVEDLETYGPDGKLLSRIERLGVYLDAMFGYKILFVERRRLLQALYNAIPDKSKLQLSRTVVKIEHVEGGVEVETNDGRVWSGSIVVGADGIHSKARQEMWRMAGEDKYKIRPWQELRGIRTPFSCIFGVSLNVDKVNEARSWKAVQQDRHYLFQAAPGRKVFWFLFFKTERRVKPGEVLKYTAEDKEKYAERFWNDKLGQGLTFGEIYESQKSSALVPLEEYTLNQYYYKRIILLGDSAHKMHPVTGQGGNTGIEDTSFLANRLKDLTKDGSVPSEAQLQHVFAQLQEERRPRTEILKNGANELARLESFHNAVFKLLMLKLVRRFPSERYLAPLAESVTPAEPLKYLPLPTRPKKLLVPFEDEVRTCPRQRSMKLTIAWMTLFLFIGSLRFIPLLDPGSHNLYLLLPKIWEPSTFAHLKESMRHVSSRPYASIASSPSPVQISSAVSHLALNGFWCLESHRSGFNLAPVSSAIPYILVSLFVGWEAAIPVFFALWVFSTRNRGWYYPWPRAIPLSTARALPIALMVCLLGGTIGLCHNYNAKTVTSSFALDQGFNALSLAHVSLPVLTAFISKIIKRQCGPQAGPEYQWGKMDMRYTSRFLAIIFLVTSTSHILFVWKYVISTPWMAGLSIYPRYSDETTRLATTTFLIASWLVFTVWDLRRVNVISIGWGVAMIYILLGIIVFGPGGTLAAAWQLREVAFDKSRCPKATY